MSRAAVIAALILAAGGVALLITGTGLWRLLLSGAAGGSAVYVLQMVQPWMAAALPGWVTPVIAVLPILLAALAVLLALAVAPTLNRTRLLGGLATAVAVGGIVAAFDWWRFDLSDRPALFLPMYLLAGPLLLSAIVLACALVAGLRRAVQARWRYAVIGLGLAVAAIAGELLIVVRHRHRRVVPRLPTQRRSDHRCDASPDHALPNPRGTTGACRRRSPLWTLRHWLDAIRSVEAGSTASTV